MAAHIVFRELDAFNVLYDSVLQNRFVDLFTHVRMFHKPISTVWTLGDGLIITAGFAWDGGRGGNCAGCMLSDYIVQHISDCENTLTGLVTVLRQNDCIACKQSHVGLDSYIHPGHWKFLACIWPSETGWLILGVGWVESDRCDQWFGTQEGEGKLPLSCASFGESCRRGLSIHILGGGQGTCHVDQTGVIAGHRPSWHLWPAGRKQ